jgi:hypothetical protein
MYRLENDSTYLVLDNYMVNFESGLPGTVYDLNDTIGHGFIVSGSGNLGGRIVSLSRVFTRDQESERKNYIEWFTRNRSKTTYLRRTTTNFDGVQEVVTSLQEGESFNIRDFNFSKELKFTAYMENPFFESTTLTISTFAISSSIKNTVTANINCNKVFPNFQMVSTKAMTQFEVKNAEGYGFRVDYNFQANDVINVSTTGSDIYLTINSIRTDGFFSSSSCPFELNSSNNTLYVKADTGTLTIKYYQQEL